MVLDMIRNGIPRQAPTVAAALLCALALSPSDGLAQSTRATGFQISNDQPININAEKFDVDDRTKLITFTGNVVAVQGENTVRAGKMVVRYAGGSTGLAAGQGDIERIDLSESVQLDTATQKATGDTGYFDMTTQNFVLQGKQVVLSEGGNVFVGCKLTVDMATSQANLDACGGRVQVKLNPQSSRTGN